MKPKNELRQADNAAATAEHDSSNTSTSASEVLVDVEKGEEAPPERVRTVTGFKVGGVMYEASGRGMRLTKLP